jgi:hypothetical protein
MRGAPHSGLSTLIRRISARLIYGERHLRRILTLYSLYYNETRTHLGLGKDVPLGRHMERLDDRHDTNLVRIASLLRADMIFGKDRSPRVLKGYGKLGSFRRYLKYCSA